MRVTYLDHMGNDLTPVNAARVSFGKTSDWVIPTFRRLDAIDPLTPCASYVGVPDYTKKHLSPEDKSLINFLARGCTSGDWASLKRDVKIGDDDSVFDHIRKMPPHWTPFGHCQITLHLKVPLFVARQIMKHQTGFVVNEVSRRYVTEEPEFYIPDAWRKAADNVKQGSSDEEITQIWSECVPECCPPDGKAWYEIDRMLLQNYFEIECFYDSMIKSGVCPEQARMVLPQSMYTEFWMTGSLFGWANMFNQRSDSHAQKETQEVARQISEVIKPLYPVSWEALTR